MAKEVHNPWCRILLVSHYYAEHRGGIELVAKALGEAMARRGGFSIVWAASDTVLPEGTPPEGMVHAPMRSCNIVEDKLHVPYPFWSPGAIWKLWRFSREADAIHLQDFFYMGNVFAFLFAKVQGKPVILTQHIGFVPYKNPVLRLVLGTVNATLGWVVQRYADQVIYISEVVKDYFSTRVRYARPPLFIPNGLDTRTFVPVSEEKRLALRADLDLPDHDPVFLFVGRFVEKKGLHILHRLAERFPEVQWVFAGWGSMDPLAWNLPNVRVVSGRSEASLAEVYQAADLLVLPSVGEGFPLVVQECMACGTPVLVCSKTALAQRSAAEVMFHEAVQESGDGSDTTDAWAALLQSLLDAPERLTAQRKVVADFAHENWSWDGCAARYDTILRELLEHDGK